MPNLPHRKNPIKITNITKFTFTNPKLLFFIIKTVYLKFLCRLLTIALYRYHA